jgi:tRNA pseudouridine32 synthase/23S rRNA pseudouridine746 synthase
MSRHAHEAPIHVLHRDADLLVVDKPSGLPTTSPDGGDCLAKRVEAMDRGAERCHPSSRLDAEVTGVVVFARSSRGIDLVVRAREEGRYARRYVALTRAPEAGSMLATNERCEWRWPIAIDPRDPRRRRALEDGARGERAQDAHTRAAVLSRSPLATSLLLEPVTGRTHQLRVHAARGGAALLGDVAYGGPRRVTATDGRVLACPRVALHCLVVVLPARDGGLRAFRSPHPTDLAELGATLELAPLDLDAIEREARASITR